jgi:molecular chaperone GrpE
MRKDSVQHDSEWEDESAPVEAPAPEAQADGTPEEADGDADEVSGDPARSRTPADTEGDTELGEVRREMDAMREKYLRLAAEFDNYRKRTARERQELGSRGQAELVKQLIDSLDDLGRVTSLDPAASEARTVIEGVEMVERKLLKALTSAGMEVLNPVDEPFNPELHEAVSTTPALSREDDSMVAIVYQVGYVFKGQLIRPARVVVKQWNG